MGSTIINNNNLNWTDSYVPNVTINDNSIAPTYYSTLPNGANFLYPIISSTGPSNVTKCIGDLASLYATYGSDVGDFKKFGQQNLNLVNTLRASGVAYVCRMMPSDASYATVMLQVHIAEDDNLPVYERDSDGNFLVDENGDRIFSYVKNDEPEADGTYADVQEVISGYRIKLVILNANGVKENPSSVVDENRVTWRVFNFLKFDCTSLGATGNNFGFRITNDSDRDTLIKSLDNSSDGRRYILDFVKVDEYGNVDTYDTSYYFAWNIDAFYDTNNTISEDFNKVYKELDSGNFYEKKALNAHFYQSNFVAIIDYLSQRFNDGGEDIDIDFITCTDYGGVAYESLVLDENSFDFRETYAYLTGGHDGSLEIGQEVPGSTGNTIVTEETRKNTIEELYKKFFRFEIDPWLIDSRIVHAAFLLDANFSLAVKQTILEYIPKYRTDIMIYMDCGLQESFIKAEAFARGIKSLYNATHPMMAIYPMCGTAVYEKEYHKVTQTYELAYAIPRVWHRIGTYTPIVAYKYGKTIRMVYDWIPAPGEERSARSAFLNVVGNLGLAGENSPLTEGTDLPPRFLSTEKTQFVNNTSKLKSINNCLVIGDVHRTMKVVLARHTYHRDGAETANSEALTELNSSFQGRYPASANVEPYITRTAKNIIDEKSTAVATVTFAGSNEGFDIEINILRGE